MWAFKTAGTNIAYTLALADFVLTDEQTLFIEFHTDCWDNATLDVNSTGAKDLKNSSGANVATDDLKSTGRYTLTYDVASDSWIIGTIVTSEIPGMNIGGIVPFFNNPTELRSAIAWESINTDQHCAIDSYYTWFNLSFETDGIKSYVWSTQTIAFGQCFERDNKWLLKTITVKMHCGGWGYVSDTYYTNLRINIYAISGTYWVDSVPTWPILYSSDLKSWTIWSSSSAIILFTLNADLPAGQYCAMIEWDVDPSDRSCRWRGDTAGGAYLGNTVDVATPIPGQNLYMLFTAEIPVVVVSDASNVNKADYWWQATESKTVGQDIILKRFWEIDQTWAVNDSAFRYLSDTPGELSSTPGTYIRRIAQSSGVNKAWMWRDNLSNEITIEQSTVYFTNTAWICWGRITTGAWSFVYTWWFIEISYDNMAWIPLSTTLWPQSWGNERFAVQGFIPAGCFFKIDMTTNSSIIWQWVYFRPIK